MCDEGIFKEAFNSQTLVVIPLVWMFSSCSAFLCIQERLLDELKVEEGEEGEVDENGIAVSSKRVRQFSNIAYFSRFL